MKLVTRLTLAFLLVVVAAISLVEWRRLDRELAEFEADMDRTHRLVATTLAEAAEAIGPRDGLAEARRVVAESGQHHPTDLRIRWVCAGDDEAPPLLPCEALGGLDEFHTFATTGPQGTVRATVVPVRFPEGRLGAIEVSESPEYERTWARRHVEAAVWLALGTVAAMALFAFVLGWWLVARPTRILVAKARAVGRGELKPDLTLATGDEFELLAAEMNAMCGHLERAREDTTRAIEHLRHADRLATVGRLASGLAHELGTPLNVIEARASLIAEDPQADEAARASAKVIIGQSEQVTRLVKQLLVFARPREAERQPVALDALARTVAEVVRPLASRKPVELDVSALVAAPSTGDPVLLQQAITNLVVNALHACGRDGHVCLETGRLQRPRPGTEAEARWVWLSVADDGVGIAEELQASIFEPFFTTRPAGEGTGLGLPIVTSIVEEHGGFLTLESTRGRGSTFTLYLPEAT